MKTRINTIITLYGLLLMASCSKDETAVTPSIVGTWEQTLQSRSNCIDAGANYLFKCPSGVCDMYEFILTGSTYIMMNKNISSTAMSTGIYTIDGNNLSLKSDIDTGDNPWKVVFSLTATTMVWDWDIHDGCKNHFEFKRL